MQPFSASSASGASFAPTEIMQIKYPSSGYNVQTALEPSYTSHSSLPAWSICCTQSWGIYERCPPATPKAAASRDLLYTFRFAPCPAACEPGMPPSMSLCTFLRYAGERRETDPAVMKPHHNRRVCRSGAVCLRIIYLIYLSFQNYITYKMTSVCHVFPASGPVLYDIITVRYASDLRSPLINSFASGPVR